MLAKYARKLYWRVWSGGACSRAAGEQQPDYARVSFAPPAARRAWESCFFAASIFFFFLLRHGALSASSFFLAHIEGTAEVQLDEKALLPSLSLLSSTLLPHMLPLSPPPLSVTMVPMQS